MTVIKELSCGCIVYADYNWADSIVEIEVEHECHLQAENADFKLHVDQMCNDLWSLLYPDNPTGWQYLTQPLVHIRVEFDRLQAEVTRLRAALEQVEWTDHQGLLYCPWCGGVKPNHADDCPRQAAMA